MHGIFQRLEPIHYTKVDFHALTARSPSCRITSRIPSSLGKPRLLKRRQRTCDQQRFSKSGVRFCATIIHPMSRSFPLFRGLKAPVKTEVLSGLVSKAVLIFFYSGSHLWDSITGFSQSNLPYSVC